jgi:DNA-binding NarL/FixJ family response regulator
MYADLRYVKSIMKIGATGYLTKDCSSEELLTAISTIMTGEIYVSHEIAITMIKDSLISCSLNDLSVLYTLLSPTEREILQLLSEGVKTTEIAQMMNISIHTVTTHRHNIMKKTGINNIAHLTKFAIKEGLTSI